MADASANANLKLLKKGGFMKQKQRDCFSMRLKTIGGQLTAQQLATIQQVAEKYGKGYIHLTSRQGVEIPFIHLEDIETVKKELNKGGVYNGVCGPRLRTITACQGNAICPSGLIDTQHLAQEFEKRYGGREFPCKFKLGITGCPNNCLKAEENDLGVKGGILPTWKQEKCIYCGLCQAVCPTKAITVDKEKHTLTYRKDDCVYCGKCVTNCPVTAWRGKAGYNISLGGSYGKNIAIGKHVIPLLTDEQDVYKVADVVLDFFEHNAKAGERFAKVLERVGWDDLEKRIKEALAK